MGQGDARGGPVAGSEDAQDRALVEGVCRGAPEAFDRLYERYFPRVYAFMQRQATNRTEAEDLAQDTFLEVFRSAASYAGRAEVAAWIFGVARNVVRRHMRVRRRCLEVEPVRDAEGACATPEDELRVQRVMERLIDELARAEPWESRGFALRYFHGLSLREVAQRAERSRYAVRATLARVRGRVLRDLV